MYSPNSARRNIYIYIYIQSQHHKTKKPSCTVSAVQYGKPICTLSTAQDVKLIICTVPRAQYINPIIMYSPTAEDVKLKIKLPCQFQATEEIMNNSFALLTLEA